MTRRVLARLIESLLLRGLVIISSLSACTSNDGRSEASAVDKAQAVEASKVEKENSKKQTKTEPSEGKPKDQRRGLQVVEVTTLKTQLLPTIVSIPVFLEGRKQVSVYPRVGGRIQSIRKQTGERIQRGQTLFAVDRSDPGESFLALPVSSPISGFVARWFVVEGDQISAGDPVVLVVDDSSLRAKIWLPVSDWQLVDKQTKVSLEIHGKTKTARIISVARAIEVSAGKGLVEVELGNEAGDWKSGFSAEAHIELSLQPRLVMPAQALLLTNDGAYVYVLEANTVKRQKIKFRPRTPDVVELEAGSLPDGTRVVISGTSRLADGLEVKVQGEGSET